MRITVVSLFRDSEPCLQSTFQNLEALERRHELDFFFYENDSLDGTATRLREWIGGRRAVVVTETLGLRKFAHTTEPDRLAAMAGFRNRIADEAAGTRSDWTLLLDSDVKFPATIVEQYLACHDPTVVMYTPFIEYDMACHMCEPACGRHAYYDTFALRDGRDRIGQVFSCNPFWDERDRAAWNRGEPVDVHCAFAGAALVRTDVLERCRWHSDGDCEHVAFARQVREHGRILAVPAVRTWTWVRETLPNPELLRRQKQLLRNPLLLRFWTDRQETRDDRRQGRQLGA